MVPFYKQACCFNSFFFNKKKEKVFQKRKAKKRKAKQTTNQQTTNQPSPLPFPLKTNQTKPNSSCLCLFFFFFFCFFLSFFLFSKLCHLVTQAFLDSKVFLCFFIILRNLMNGLFLKTPRLLNNKIISLKKE